MYVDDSGTPNIQDDVRYYVISGVIVYGSELYLIEKSIEDYKNEYFTDAYKDEEIHTHEIYHSRGNFTKLTLGTKYRLLTNLYEMINELPVTVITVAIDKFLMNEYLPDWNIFNRFKLDIVKYLSRSVS